MSYSDFFTFLEASAKSDAGGPIRRTNPLPIDSTSVIKSSELSSYLSGATVYPGQVISVYDEDANKISFFGISLNSDGEFETRPLGGGSDLNSVQKIVMSNDDTGDDSIKTCAFKNALSSDSRLDKSNKLSYLESDASYILDPIWKEDSQYSNVLKISLENGKVYHNITFPKDVAISPVFEQGSTFSFRDSNLTFLLLGPSGEEEKHGWSNIDTFRSNVFFIPSQSNLVSNFWDNTRHVHRMSKVVYDYGTPTNTIQNGVLEIYESEIHIYGGSGDFYPKPVLSGQSGQSGKIYLHGISAIEIPEEIEAAIEIIVCPENNNPNAIIGYSHQKGIKISGRSTKYKIEIDSTKWKEDIENDGYKYEILESEHKLFTLGDWFPSIKTYSYLEDSKTWEEVYDSPEINLTTGTITVRVSQNTPKYLVVISE